MMTGHVPTTLLGIALVLAMPLAAPLAAQSAPTPACALLSTSEIRQATGIQEYGTGSNGDQEGEGMGGGSSCQWDAASFVGKGAPLLSLVLIRGKGYTERMRDGKPTPGCKQEPVSGVGDLAFFESCRTDSSRTPPLFVKVGSNDLLLQMDVEPPTTVAAARALVVNVAKAAVAKLR